MEGYEKNGSMDSESRDEVYSIPIRAGKRTYFFDVKSTRNNDYYLTITESKKVENEGSRNYEKHKIFLYKEDFEKFTEGLENTLAYIRNLLENGSSEPSFKSKYDGDIALWQWCNYGLNIFACGDNSSKMKITKVRQASRFLIFGESYWFAWKARYYKLSNWAEINSSWNGVLYPQHGRTVNVVYADGHVVGHVGRADSITGAELFYDKASPLRAATYDDNVWTWDGKAQN